MTVIITAIFLILCGMIAHLITIRARGQETDTPMTRKEIHILITKVVLANALVVGLPVAALIGLSAGVA